MFYVNGERVKLDGDSKYAKEFQEKKPEIEQLGWPVKLRVVNSWVSGTLTRDGQWVQHVPPQYIGYEATEFREDEGSVEWRYSPRPARRKGDELIFPIRGERFFENNKRVMSFGKDKIDLLFFLLYKSSHMGSIYEVVDEKGEAQKRVDGKREQVRLTEALYGTNSNLSGNPILVRTIAQSWGISIAGKTEEILLDQLERTVLNGERMKKKGKSVRGIDEFVEDTKMGEKTKVRAVIQEATDRNVIAFNENTHNYGWFFLDSEGKWSSKILTMSPRSYDMRQQKLAEYLVHNKSVLNMLKSEIGQTEDTDDFDPSRIRDPKYWKELIKKGKELNIQVVGRPKEEVFVDFEQRYKVGNTINA